MPRPESAARGRALLRARVERAPEVVAGIPGVLEPLLAWRAPLPRCLVTTGIGTSEGHARHLAELAARTLGQPARFAATGSLAEGPPPGAEADWLVVFSQGLSANARHALASPERWGGVVLVTGLDPARADAETEGLDPEKRAWLEALAARGVLRIDLGCGPEYGTLLRVIGARAGYAVGWSLLRSLARRRLMALGALEIEAARLRRAQESASSRAARSFPEDAPVAPFFAPERPVVLVAEGGAGALVDQLSLKLAEGLLRPRPSTLDVLELAHGPLQGLTGRPASILHLRTPDEAAGGWGRRLAASLDPEHHDLRVIETSLPWPFAAIELEAIFDALVLRALDETGLDLVDWPGAEREGALYRAGPALETATASTASAPSSCPSTFSSTSTSTSTSTWRDALASEWEAAVWPELEAGVAGGRRTALLALGSIEQHGPHLPLGTDRWIAEALARALAARLDDAVALPAVAVGCASEHLDFAGTLHVEPATLEAMLRDLLRSIAGHGFERAFVFTAHGGNVEPLREMRTRLAAAVAPLVLRVETDLRVGAMQAGVVAEAALPANAAGPHAGEYETSLVAWLRPGSVRLDPLAPGRLVDPGEAQGLFYPSLRPNAERGVLGDPTAASAARGPRYLAGWVDLLEVAYREAFRADGSAAGPGPAEADPVAGRSPVGRTSKKRQ